MWLASQQLMLTSRCLSESMAAQWISAQVSSGEGERLNCPVTSALKLKSTLKDERTKYSGDPTTSACCVRRRAAARVSVCTCVYTRVPLWVQCVFQYGWHCAKDWGRRVEQVQLGIGGPTWTSSHGLLPWYGALDTSFTFQSFFKYHPLCWTHEPGGLSLCRLYLQLSSDFFLYARNFHYNSTIYIPAEPLLSSYAWHNHKYSTNTHTYTNWLCN